MKPSDTKFINSKLEDIFNRLSDEDPLKKALKKAIKEIQNNMFIGRNVKKKLIPKKLIIKYDINNLWIYNHPSAWRLLYTLTRDKNIKIIAIILDWMNHKDYEKLFNF